MLKIVFLLAMVTIGVLGYTWYIDSQVTTAIHTTDAQKETANISEAIIDEDIEALEKAEQQTHTSESKTTDVEIEDEEDIDIIEAMQNAPSQDNNPPEVLTDEEIEVQIIEDVDLLLKLEKNEGN